MLNDALSNQITNEFAFRIVQIGYASDEGMGWIGKRPLRGIKWVIENDERAATVQIFGQMSQDLANIQAGQAGGLPIVQTPSTSHLCNLLRG